MKLKKAAIVLAFVLFAGAFAQAKDIYIAQNAAGTNSGADCSNAHAASWFNSSSNWGSGTSQIGPGTVVHLCGTFTGSSSSAILMTQASGTSSSPITILFENGAVLQAPYFGDNGAIYISGESYIIIDGGTNGIIQNTANGTTLANHVYVSSGISASGNNLEFRNLTCRNIYVRTSGTDHYLSGGPSQNNCLHFSGGSNISIHDNVMHDAGWTIWYGMASGSASNVTIYNNDLYHTDHGIGFGEGGASGKTFSNLTIYNNHFHDPVNMDDTASSLDSQWYHHDGIHLFAYCSGSVSCSQTTMSNVNIYNNLFDGDWGIGISSLVFMEGIYYGLNFYNNVALIGNGRYANNGLFNLNANDARIMNNTIIGSTTSAGYCLITNSEGGTSSIKNNVISTCQGLIYPQSGSFSGGIDNNVYSNGGNQMFQWQGKAGTTNFSTWQSNSGGDAHGKVASSLGLSNGVPGTGSAVIGAGANLTSLGLAPLNADRLGNGRPGSGSWDAGAYNGSGSAQVPNPPTGVKAVAH